MAVSELFNTYSGYSVGIPPIPVINGVGNVTANNLTVAGNANIIGNLTAFNFRGDFSGNVSANLSINGPNKELAFNKNGILSTTSGVQFDSTSNTLVITNNISTNKLSMGTGDNEFYSVQPLLTTTFSIDEDQVLHTFLANSALSVEYTIVAVDTALNFVQASKLFVGVSETDIGYFEFGTIDTPPESSGVGDFKVNFVGDGSVTLTVSPYTSNRIVYKIVISSIKT